MATNFNRAWALLFARLVLGLIFFMAGVMKVAMPKEKLLPTMKWAETWSVPQLRALGTVEVVQQQRLVVGRGALLDDEVRALSW